MKEVGGKYVPELFKSYVFDNGLKFTLREENYIKLAANGLKPREIALELRTSQSTIKRMLNDNPNISKAVEYLQREIIDSKTSKRQKIVDDLYDKAIGELKGLLKCDDKWAKMNAIRLIFERHDKMTALAQGEDKGITVVFEGMTEPPKPINRIIEAQMSDVDNE